MLKGSKRIDVVLTGRETKGLTRRIREPGGKVILEKNLLKHTFFQNAIMTSNILCANF